MLKTYIHYDIVYNSSLHHAIHALKSIARMEKPKEYGKSFYRNVHDKIPNTKNMESHLHRMCMTKTLIKRNGSHSYRNVNDENPFKKKW